MANRFFNSLMAGTPSSAIVAGAGTAEVNGTYTYQGVWNTKPYYTLVGQPSSSTASAISWSGIAWFIYGAGGDEYYVSSDLVMYPWLAIFTRGTGADPVPTVTRG